MKLSLYLSLAIMPFVTIEAQERLPEWEPGFLDVHFISTGCGNCAVVIMVSGDSRERLIIHLE